MSPATRYRFAAFVLAFVGLLITLLAPPASAQVDRSGELQKLVNDFGYQLDLVGQLDRSIAETRRRQLAIALDRWNTSTRTQADFLSMQRWLKASIQASMPGRSKPMPKLPWFEERLADRAKPAAAPQPNRVVAAVEPPAVDVQRPTLPKPAIDTELPAVAEPNSSVVAEAWERHPAAKPLDLGDPFADDPPVVSPAVRTRRVAMRPAPLAVEPASAKVDINVAELGARVRGYVHGLRGVEARLLRQSDMTPEGVLRAARELKQLAGQRDFVSLYLNALSPAERARTAELPSLDRAKRLVSDRIDVLTDRGQLSIDAAESLQSALASI